MTSYPHCKVQNNKLSFATNLLASMQKSWVNHTWARGGVQPVRTGGYQIFFPIVPVLKGAVPVPTVPVLSQKLCGCALNWLCGSGLVHPVHLFCTKFFGCTVGTVPVLSQKPCPCMDYQPIFLILFRLEMQKTQYNLHQKVFHGVEILKEAVVQMMNFSDTYI